MPGWQGGYLKLDILHPRAARELLTSVNCESRKMHSPDPRPSLEQLTFQYVKYVEKGGFGNEGWIRGGLSPCRFTEPVTRLYPGNF